MSREARWTFSSPLVRERFEVLELHHVLVLYRPAYLISAPAFKGDGKSRARDESTHYTTIQASRHPISTDRYSLAIISKYTQHADSTNTTMSKKNSLRHLPPSLVHDSSYNANTLV